MTNIHINSHAKHLVMPRVSNSKNLSTMTLFLIIHYHHLLIVVAQSTMSLVIVHPS